MCQASHPDILLKLLQSEGHTGIHDQVGQGGPECLSAGQGHTTSGQQPVFCWELPASFCHPAVAATEADVKSVAVSEPQPAPGETL